MSSAEEDRKRAARAERLALFRYQLIREAADPALTVRQRGRLVRELAARAHAGPSASRCRVTCTIDRWIRAWQGGGFAALAPPARRSAPHRAAVLELAAALKRENPERTAAQVRRILRPDVRLVAVGADAAAALRAAGPDHRPRPGPAVFGRFEARRPNEMWTGDALHGPQIAGRKTYLFAFLDDHSRAVMAARLGLQRGHHAAGRRAAPGRWPPGASRARLYVDYAEQWIMPTPAGRACSPAVNGRKVSA